MPSPSSLGPMRCQERGCDGSLTIAAKSTHDRSALWPRRSATRGHRAALSSRHCVLRVAAAWVYRPCNEPAITTASAKKQVRLFPLLFPLPGATVAQPASTRG